EIEPPMENQPLPTNASPTALLPGYINDSNPEEDEEDPKEDPDGEDDEEVEHLAPVDPSVVPIDDHETMTTVNQGMSVEEIQRVVVQRVAHAIKGIAIYETKTNLARKSMSQTEQQKEKVEENACNKRKWEGPKKASRIVEAKWEKGGSNIMWWHK
nr:hypothetical protein [Tanacetum cinerariifolium]